MTLVQHAEIGMSTNSMDFPLQDRRQDIMDAGLSVLRQHGYAGFTQPRIAALAGLRQSHLTYYHPTRLDLLKAVGRVAVDRQLEAVDASLASISAPEDAALTLATLVIRKENTRVLMALAQAGDEEPALRELFRELADGIASRFASFLGRAGMTSSHEVLARLLHAQLVGLAVIDLARGDSDGEKRAATALQYTLQLIFIYPISTTIGF